MNYLNQRKSDVSAGWVLLALSAFLLADINPVSAQPQTQFALIPLNHRGSGQDDNWVGYGLTLRLMDYLGRVEGVDVIPQSRVEQVAQNLNVPYSSSLQAEQAYRLCDALSADCVVWGDYEIVGRTALCHFRVVFQNRKSVDEFRISGRIHQFDSLAQNVLSEIYRLLGQPIPASLMRSWREEKALGEEYRYYVLAQMPGLESTKRLKNLQEYLKHDPENLKANLLLAEWTKENSSERALQLYQQIARSNPDCGLTHAHLGYLLAEKDQREEARQAYRKAIACKDRYPEAYFNYGNLLRRMMLTSEAIRIYQEGIKKFPDYAYLHFNLSLLYDESGRTEEAREAYRTAYNLDKTLQYDFFRNRFYLNDLWIEWKEDWN